MATANKSVRLSVEKWEALSAKAERDGVKVNALIAKGVDLILADDQADRAAISDVIKRAVEARREPAPVSVPAGAKLSSPRPDTGARWGFNGKGRK